MNASGIGSMSAYDEMSMIMSGMQNPMIQNPGTFNPFG